MEWINVQEIAKIDGALKAAAYVARAYRYAQDHGGQPPAWARKLENGRWQFALEYIREDAAAHSRTLSVADAAKMVGVTRRTVQAWVDKGEVPLLGGGRQRGETRQILKAPFLRLVPQLMKRLETPAVIGYRTRHGKPVPQQALERLAAEKAARETDAVKRRARRIQAHDDPTAVAAPENIQARLQNLESLLTTSVRATSLAAREARRARSTEERLKDIVIRAQTELRAARQALWRATHARRDAVRNQDLKAAAERSIAAEESGLKAAAQAAKREAREKGVAELEAQLRAAKETQKKEAALEEKARSIAQRIADDMFDNKIARPDALALFNKAAEERGIPPEVRDRVRKEVLGR